MLYLSTEVHRRNIPARIPFAKGLVAKLFVINKIEIVSAASDKATGLRMAEELQLKGLKNSYLIPLEPVACRRGIANIQ